MSLHHREGVIRYARVSAFPIAMLSTDTMLFAPDEKTDTHCNERAGRAIDESHRHNDNSQ